MKSTNRKDRNIKGMLTYGMLGVFLTAMTFALAYPIYSDLREAYGYEKFRRDEIIQTLEEMNAPPLWEAIVMVESGGDLNAVGQDGELGPMQIRPIMVEEVNRVSGKRFTLEDRTSMQESIRMFETYTTYWNAVTKDNSLEGAARRWNGGPLGHRKDSTLPYWEKVKAQLER
jgi:hypothetical protein